MMQFPRRDAMTPAERQQNAEVVRVLERGKYYRFDPPVTATAVPTGGPSTCALTECQFDRGWYIGFVEENHVFQGKPINDQRAIPVPPGYEGSPVLEILEKLRESYFHVLFIGGESVPTLDPDQSH